MDSRAPTPRHVLFNWKHGGNSVGLSGSWDDWKSVIPMQKNPDGSWFYVRPLLPGYYEYKYLVDGYYKEDPTLPLTSDKPWRNNWIEVMSPVRIKLHGSRTKRGPPSAFGIDFLASMQTILTKAKELHHIPTTSRLVFALKDGTILSSVADFREDEHVYLDPETPGSVEDESNDDSDSQESKSRVKLKPGQLRLVCTNDDSVPDQIFESEKELVDTIHKIMRDKDGRTYRIERSKPNIIRI